MNYLFNFLNGLNNFQLFVKFIFPMFKTTIGYFFHKVNLINNAGYSNNNGSCINKVTYLYKTLPIHPLVTEP